MTRPSPEIVKARRDVLAAARRWSSAQERTHLEPYTEPGAGPGLDRKAELDAHNALRCSVLAMRRLEAEQ